MTLQCDTEGLGDLFVLGLDGEGVPQWIQGFSAPNRDFGMSIDAFDDGAVVVSGYVNDVAGLPSPEAAFSDGETVSLDDWTSNFLVRYEADGTRASHSGGTTVQVLADGCVAQAGYFITGAVVGVGEPNEAMILSNGLSDLAIALHSP